MKFHDNMHVRLRSGVEIVGLTLLSGGRPTSRGLGIWMADGLRYPRAESPSDIVEVLSSPPVVCGKDIEPKVGMRLRSFSNTSTIVTVSYVEGIYVVLSEDGHNPRMTVWGNLSDWTVEA